MTISNLLVVLQVCCATKLKQMLKKNPDLMVLLYLILFYLFLLLLFHLILLEQWLWAKMLIEMSITNEKSPHAVHRPTHFKVIMNNKWTPWQRKYILKKNTWGEIILMNWYCHFNKLLWHNVTMIYKGKKYLYHTKAFILRNM